MATNRHRGERWRVVGIAQNNKKNNQEEKK